MVMLALALAYAGPHFPPPGPPAWKGGPPPHAAVLAHAQAHNPHFGGEALDGLDNDGDGLIDNLLFADADAVLRAPEGSRLTHMHSVGALVGNAGEGLVIASQDGLAFIAIEATQDGALVDYPVLYGASIGRSAARVGGTVLIGEPDADVVHHMDATTLEPLAVQTGVRGFGSALSAWDDRYWAAGASKSGQVQLFDATGSLVRTVSRPHSQLADLGYAVAVGDLLHGDDVPDLVFGGPTSSDPKPGENKGTGVAYVLGASGACSWVWGGGQCQLIYGEIGPARVGHALEAMADVTADGHSDWLAGAPDYYGQGLVTVKAGGTIPDAHNGLASFASTRLWGAPDSFLGA
ncbi:MAG: hypothetical protein KC912_20165, partial [Proteobacteria bacterium]|nr:hypothetical protein [Pseudomonadota bacterium]